MKFGPLPTAEAEEAILAHTVKLSAAVIKKGTRLAPAHIESLLAENVADVICARLEQGDIHEDEAAQRIARFAAGQGIRVDRPFTGRCNIFAEQAGVLQINEAAVNALNGVDPGLTFATLPAFAPVEAGRMVATAKIIPFALPGHVVDQAERQGEPGTILQVAPFQPLAVGLIQTELSSLKPSILDKTRRVTEQRLAPAGSTIVAERRVPHRSDDVAEAISQLFDLGARMLIIFGASAVIDKDDVIPTAIRAAGGSVSHFGMPVDPGNLLLLGEFRGYPVIGAPGCARSAKENGFDWILNKLLAKLQVLSEDLTGMGVGGLLMEIVSRPQPRQPISSTGGVAVVVLAAGQSRRMGSGRNKLLAKFGGEALVRRSVRSALASKGTPVIVVTGHMDDRIRSELEGLEVSFAHNPHYADGLSTSLKCGIAAVPEDATGALVMLADMPGVDTASLDKLVDAFNPAAGRSIILPTASGKRGNPVIWARDYFAALCSLSGDIGARHLLAEHEEAVHRVDIGQNALIDVDTPEALAAAGGRFIPERNRE